MAIDTLGAALRRIDRLLADGAVTGLSDAQLLERFVARRDPTAFEAIVARHGPMVLSVCRGTVHDPGDAEDAFQAVFLILVKKAGTIRGRVILGGWLYRVARRAASEANRTAARRRAHELRAGRMAAAASPPGATAADDLLPALHEEIARLPEKYRLPVVLCDLEGIPQAEAAGRLHWSERTLRRRLAEARDRLRSRLRRRGLGPEGAALSAAFLREAVPPAWGAAAVRAAIDTLNPAVAAGAVSAAARSLMQEVLRTMFVQNLTIAATALLCAGLMAWMATAAVIARRDDPPGAAPVAVARRTAPSPRPEPEPEPDPLDGAGTFPVRGLVVDPDGMPVVGAGIHVFHRADITEKADPRSRPGRVTATGADGRFRFDLDRAASDWPYGEGPAWREARIAAVAPGFGTAWVDAGTIARTGEVTLQLPRDDVPIRGRVVDTQGHPLAGVAIQAVQLNAPKEGRDLDAMLASGGYDSHQSDAWFPAPTWLGRDGTWTTDADGRFEIHGVGHDRIVRLEVVSPALEKAFLYAMARPSTADARPRPRPSLPPGVPRELIRPPVPRLVGSTFDVVAGPTRPIVGVVRLKGTGKPVAGVNGYGYDPATGIQAGVTTDAEGRFRLVGLPKAGAYQIRFEPRPGDPYLGAVVDLTDTEGLAPLTADVELPPGVPVTGRLIDAATGRPVQAMHVAYSKLPTNRNDGQPSWGRISVRDRSFLITVPPGEGAFLAGVAGLDDRFRPARLRKEDKGRGVGGTGDQETYNVMLSGYHAYQIVDVPAGADRLSVELTLTRGATQKGRLIGPEGQPVAGADAYGLSARWGSIRTLDADTFEVGGLEPGHPRRVVFSHRARKLVGAIVLEDEASPSGAPLEVKLGPPGSIAGRLVDDDGTPVARARLKVMPFDLDGNNLPFGMPRALWPSSETFLTDEDGRFRIEGFVPGVATDVIIEAPTRPDSWLDTGKALRKLNLGPGEVRDLGDVRGKVVRN